MEESLEDGQQLGLVRAGDRKAMAALGLGAIKELLVQRVTGVLDASADKLAAETMRFVASGILAPGAVVESALGVAAGHAEDSAARAAPRRQSRR